MEVHNLSKLSNSTLNGGTHYQTHATGCSLTNVEFHTSRIQKSKLHNCRVYDCEMIDCEVTSTTIYGGNTLKCQFDKTTFRHSPPSLSKLPIEIRKLIFKPCLEWSGKTPEPLAALRGDKQLYGEALAIFNEINTFHIDGDTHLDIGDSFQALSESVRRNLKHLELAAEIYELDTLARPLSKSTATPPKLETLVLILDCDEFEPDDVEVLSQLISLLRGTLKRLDLKLCVSCGNLDDNDPQLICERCYISMSQMYNLYSKHFGLAPEVVVDV